MNLASCLTAPRCYDGQEQAINAIYPDRHGPYGYRFRTHPETPCTTEFSPAQERTSMSRQCSGHGGRLLCRPRAVPHL